MNTTTSFSDTEKYMTSLLNTKNARIGKAIVELEETRKALTSVLMDLKPAVRRKLRARVDSISTLVEELTH